MGCIIGCIIWQLKQISTLPTKLRILLLCPTSLLFLSVFNIYFTVYFLPPLVVYKICCDGFCFYFSENLPIPRIGLVCRKCLIKIDIARMPDFSSECISTQSSCIFHTHCTYYLLSHYTCLSVLEGLADSYIFRSESLMLFMWYVIG